MITSNYSEIIENLIRQDNFIENYRETLEEAFGGGTLWLYCSVDVSQEKPNMDFIKKNLREKRGICEVKDKRSRNYLKCLDDVEEGIGKSIKKNKIFSFKCYGARRGVSLPLSGEEGDVNKVYAVILICNIKVDLTQCLLRLLEVFKNVISDLLIKENELRNLKETLHPRAVALSTIHTVHRIIASTLELDKLLPKIARLCLQVIRANRCTISLMDEEEKYLIPHVTVDLNDPEAKSRKIKLGRGNVGKVGASGTSYKSDKCISMPLVDTEVIGVLTIRDKQGRDKFDVYDEEILFVLSEQASVAICNAMLYEEQKKVIVESVRSLSSLLNVQIPSPYINDIGFVDIMEEIGRRIGINESKMNALRYSAMLRNVARVGIPGEILLKPDELTEAEYEFVKQRTKEIVDVIEPLDVLKPAIPILIHYREKYDGSGYPDGLKGKDIPLGARMMAVIDAFEAMITSRPYQKAISVSDAVKEIKKHKGDQFDPNIVEIFLGLVEDGTINEILKEHEIKVDL